MFEFTVTQKACSLEQTEVTRDIFYSVIQISGAVHVESAPIETVLETQLQLLITALSATIITRLVPRPSHRLQAIKI